MTVRLSIDVLRDDNFSLLANQRVGLFTSPSAVDGQLISTYQILSQAENVQLVALFSGEHGYLGFEADSVKIASSVDQFTNLPVYSLYSDTHTPSADMLKDIDVILCDVQDVGVRYYTFVWSISYILQVAAENDIRVMILDRPNPLGGSIKGPVLEDRYSSFVGRYPATICHGMTIGELAQMMNQHWQEKPAHLTVIPCAGWYPTMLWTDVELPWIPTSPNMPHFSTVQHYAGACLVEGTNLSEGRGTPLPFEWVGAPYIDAYKLAQHLNAQNWTDVRFRPCFFRPLTSKHAGSVCQGVQTHITGPAFDALTVWLGIIREIRQLYPDDFAWLPPRTDGQTSVYHFDRLIGNGQVREQIEKGDSISDITADWAAQAEQFETLRQPYLLYS